MSAFACSGCSAPLPLPADLTALDAACPFCGTRTTLPADVAKLRLQEQSQLFEEREKLAEQAQIGVAVAKSRSLVLWIVILSTVLPLVLTGVIFVVVYLVSSHAVQHVPHHR
jgi:hypothetical protein